MTSPTLPHLLPYPPLCHMPVLGCLPFVPSYTRYYVLWFFTDYRLIPRMPGWFIRLTYTLVCGSTCVATHLTHTVGWLLPHILRINVDAMPVPVRFERVVGYTHTHTTHPYTFTVHTICTPVSVGYWLFPDTRTRLPTRHRFYCPFGPLPHLRSPADTRFTFFPPTTRAFNTRIYHTLLQVRGLTFTTPAVTPPYDATPTCPFPALLFPFGPYNACSPFSHEYYRLPTTPT